MKSLKRWRSLAAITLWANKICELGPDPEEIITNSRHWLKDGINKKNSLFLDLELSNEIDTNFLDEDDQEMSSFLGSIVPVDDFQKMSTLHNNAASSSLQRYREV